MELDEDRLNEIAAKARPGAKVASHKQTEAIPGLDASASNVDLEAIDVVALRNKYLERIGTFDEDLDAPGGGGGGADPVLPDDAEDDDLSLSDVDDPQEQMFDVEYEEAGSTHTKTWIVETSSGEVLGEQG